MPVSVLVRCFKAETARIGGVGLLLHRLVSSDSLKETGDVYDAIAGITEAYLKERGCDLVEVEVEGSQARIIHGDSREYQGPRLLFPRPSRLYRLGVLRGSALTRVEGYYVVDEGGIEWYEPGKDYYVYESRLEAPDDVIYVIIDSEHGRRWVRTLRHAITRLSSQTPQGRGGGSPESGGGQGGDSSPSS